MSSNVVLIALDGATFDVIKPLCNEGRLPNLSKLMQEGTSGDLRSTIPPVTAPAFSSLLTGCNPGQHGVFDFYGRKSGSYNPEPQNGASIGAETLPAIFSRQGRTTGTVNIPMTYPPRPLNGYTVTGMMTPPGAPYTYPPDLQATLDEAGYRIELDTWYRRGHEEKTLGEILALLRTQVGAVVRLMKERPSDLFAVVFRATDLAQHYFWRFSDPDHPGYTPEEGDRYGGFIAQAYEACDDAVGQVVQAAGEDATVLVVSDHGFGRETKMVHLSNWLHREGYLLFKDNLLGRAKKLTFDLGFTADNVMNTLGRFGLEKLFTRVSRETKSKVFTQFFLSYADIDWSRTKAYARGQIGQIFLNMKGREPHGIVEPGDEYLAVRSDIISHLHDLTDPQTGDHIVDRVYVQEELFTGTFADQGPDIFIEWKDMDYWAFDFLAGGRKIVAPNLLTRSGGHRMNGILVAHGPEIAAGKEVVGAQILDVAPTALHVAGLPVPEAMDGAVLQSVFAEGSESARRPVAYESADVSRSDESPGYSSEEEAQVKKRLNQLGYL